MTELFPPTLADQIECVEREVRMRTTVYARRIAQGKMSLELAEREAGRMRAVLDTLLRVRDGLKVRK